MNDSAVVAAFALLCALLLGIAGALVDHRKAALALAVTGLALVCWALVYATWVALP